MASNYLITSLSTSKYFSRSMICADDLNIVCIPYRSRSYHHNWRVSCVMSNTKIKIVIITPIAIIMIMIIIIIICTHWNKEIGVCVHDMHIPHHLINSIKKFYVNYRLVYGYHVLFPSLRFMGIINLHQCLPTFLLMSNPICDRNGWQRRARFRSLKDDRFLTFLTFPLYTNFVHTVISLQHRNGLIAKLAGANVYCL